MNAEAPFERVAGIARHQFRQRPLGPGLRSENVDRPPALLGEHLLQRFAIVEVRGRMNLPRQILLVQIDLLEQRGEEFGRVEFLQVLPEELAPVQHAPAAQVKKIDGHQRAFLVEAQDVRFLAGICRHFLPLAKFFQGPNLVAIAGRVFKLQQAGRLRHAAVQAAHQIAFAAFQQQPSVARGLRVSLRRGQAFHARPQAALDVKLQARPRMITRQVHVARRNEKVAVNEIHDAIGEVGGKVRAKVNRPVFLYAARHINAREAFVSGELDVGVRLVIAQQDVVAGLDTA